jgi:carboxyl-terminal processing protease
MIRHLTITLACALLALAAGLFLGGHPDSLPGFLRNAFVENDRAVQAELIDTIEDNFYKPVSEKKLKESSLKGVVGALHDRFSHYLTPAEAKQFNESVSGQFEGIGMTVEQDKRGLQVLNVFDGSPAKGAGIRKGDLITTVNGRSIAGVSSDVATGRIKGRAGTRVRLKVLTPATNGARGLTVTRRRIEVPVARGRVVERGGKKLGVVQLLSFSSGAHGLVRRQVEKVERKGAKGIVLDLRGNGGGLLTEAVLVSSIFIEDGRIVSVRGRHRPERVENAEGRAIAGKLPVVVLVDGGSASASEIVTGALRDRHRATVVGTHTFGKGLVQEVEPLSNGGVLDLTVANYYLPGGKTITPGKGLPPQVRARDNPRTPRDEALPKALDTLAAKSR